MAEIVIGIGAKVVECLGGPILDRACYLFRFKKFTGELKEAEGVLKQRLEEVKERMEQAARNSEEIMLPVKNWLNEVEKILEDVHELQRKAEEEGKSCFNVSLRYSLAKQMDNKAKRMMELKKESYFEKDHFSHLTQVPGISYFSSEGFEYFKSRESTYKSLLEVIKNGKNKMVGLYGMGGSGKTTLAKEVGKKVDKARSFEKVIMAVVSKPPNIAKIQQEIAEQIDLKLQVETQLARAQKLSNGLKNKKILIILDDVWEYLKLEDIGIEGCHILLTTRLRNVCGSMGCETIELPLITRKEAWELFKKNANLCNDSSNMFDDVGRKIVDECKELPIAIVVVGRSLKGKHIGAWESALRRLERSQPLNVEQGLTNVNTCLELSYDGLSSSTAKLLFLLCSMFPEDHEIHKEDLIRFGKRMLELEESIVTMEDARREILDALNILLDSCLLMSIEKEACVKMHDLVRDVALWIAKKQRQAILVDKNVVSNMMISNRQGLDTKALSLWNLDGDFNLYDQLHCSTLEILLLQPHGSIKDLGATEALKVLAIIEYGFKWGSWWWHYRTFCSITQSIVSLTNLHTLCLRGKTLGDISLLGELKGLEILDLHGSSFDELPIGIVEMKMLKLLDIYNCQIEKSPLEVIGRCEQLEELYFWDRKSIIPKNFSLSGLKRYVLYDSTCSKLGAYYDPFEEFLDSGDEALSALCIQGFIVSTLNSSMKDLIRRANHLWLDNCRWDHKDINLNIKHLGVSNCQEKRFIIENRDRTILPAQVFSHLITLRLFEMNSLEQVFQDSSMSYSLPMLQQLWIQSCPELRTCIFSHGMVMSLPKLRKLTIDGCDKVKWLLSYSLDFRCPSLEEITIKNCSELERLIDEEDAHGNPLLHDMQYHPHGNETGRAYVGVTAKSFNQLQKQQSLLVFLRLKRLQIERSGRKKGIFEIQLRRRIEDHQESIKAQEHLKLDSELSVLRLEGLPELEYIWKGPTQIVSLHRLEYVSLSICPKLKSIFTLTIVASFPELKILEVRYCEEWEGIFCEESLKNISSSNVCFPKLRRITIFNCNKVRCFSNLALASHCPSLDTISIYGCSEFERLIDEEATDGDSLLHDMQDYSYGNETDSAYLGVTAKNLVQWQNQQSLILFLRLKRLLMARSGRKQGIFEIQLRRRIEDDQESIKAQEHLKLDSELSELGLEGLPELEYIWKGPTQIVSLHRLEHVSLSGCPKLKSIFTLTIVASFPELKTLGVNYCEEWEGIFCEESLKNLSSSNVCFPKLSQINISGCKKVRWLLSYSLASHCPSLETISILRCSKFERLIDEETTDGDSLLHDMQDYSYKHEKDTARVVNLELGLIYLHGLSELEYIWKGPTQILSLHRLEVIRVYDCPKLRNMFTLAIVTSLPGLKELEVSECEEWEGIFCEESLRNLSTSSIVCFPKLERIYIEDCHKVRRVFSYSLASHCPSLEQIAIRNCCQLEGVVQAYEGEEVAAHHQSLFPKLNYLDLQRLPKLRDIYPGYEFNHLSDTIDFQIEDCPNICNIPLEDKASSSALEIKVES